MAIAVIIFNFLVFLTTTFGQQRVLQVGLLAARDDPQIVNQVGWRRVASAVGVAWDRVVAEQILSNMEINITFWNDDCMEYKTVGSVIEMADYDIILGPPCSGSALVAASAGKSLNIPLVYWGPPYVSTLVDAEAYPTIMTTSSATRNQARTLLRILDKYNWESIAIVYYQARSPLIPRCTLVLDALDRLIMESLSNVSVVYRKRLRGETLTEMRTAWLLAIADEKADSDEFVWIQFEAWRGGFNEVWKDKAANPDGRDADAYRVAKKMFIVDSQPINGSKQFTADVIAKFKQPPYNCNNCTDVDPTSSNVGELADSMVLYARALNASIRNGILNPTGKQLAGYAAGIIMTGYTGTVRINFYKKSRLRGSGF